MNFYPTNRQFNKIPFFNLFPFRLSTIGMPLALARVTVARVADPERQNFDFGTFPGSMD